VALAPGLTVMLAAVAGLERIRPRHVLGLTVAFAGVVVVVALGSGQSLSLESAQGPVLVLGAAVSFALYNVILKPLLGRYDLLALTAATSLIGSIAFLPFVRGSTVDVVADPSPAVAAEILYLGVLATLLGYIGWNYGLRGLGPTRAVTYAYAIPPLAVVLGAVFLDEEITAWLAVGAVLVVGGIVIAQRGLPGRGLVSVLPWRSAPSRSEIGIGRSSRASSFSNAFASRSRRRSSASAASRTSTRRTATSACTPVSRTSAGTISRVPSNGAASFRRRSCARRSTSSRAKTTGRLR
jgi:uncharacterized membrane protein